VGAATSRSFASNSGNLWLLYQQAKTFKVLPSDLLFIHDDPVAAYSLNNAVWLFGTSLEAELERNPRPDKETRKEQQRRTRILNRWIPKAPAAEQEEQPSKPTGKFREPRPTV
jgi:hypothetical protein